MNNSKFSKILFAAIAGLFVFSITASAEPVDDLIAAIRAKNEELALQIFSANNIDPDAGQKAGPCEGDTIFAQAVRNGQWKLAERMLRRGLFNYDASCSLDKGRTPLWYAAKEGQWNLAKLILVLHRNANVDASPTEGPDKGATVLWLAADDENWEMAEYMYIRADERANINASPLQGRYSGHTVLWETTRLGTVALRNRMLENPNADLNARPTHDDTSYEGQSVFWLIASDPNDYNSDLIKSVLTRFPNIDVNVGPTYSDANDNATALWFIAYNQDWDNLRLVIKTHPEANIDFIPDEVIYDSDLSIETVLGLATRDKEWALVEQMIIAHPTADIEFSPGGRPSVFAAAVSADQGWLVNRMIDLHPEIDLHNSNFHIFQSKNVHLRTRVTILLMNRDVLGEDLAARLNNPLQLSGYNGIATAHLVTETARIHDIFRRIALGLPDFRIHTLPTVPPTLGGMPKDLRWAIALRVLQKELQEVTGSSVAFSQSELKKLLERFQKHYNHDPVDVVASGVLDNLRSVDGSGLVGYREMITNRIKAILRDHPVETNLAPNGRVHLVQFLTPIFAAMRQALSLFVVDKSRATDKRPREEVLVEEERFVRHRPDADFEEANRAEITQAVIAAQPSLDWRGINAEVDEIMGGVTPMQFDPNPYEDHDNNDAADVARLLKTPPPRADWSFGNFGGGSGQM